MKTFTFILFPFLFLVNVMMADDEFKGILQSVDVNAGIVEIKTWHNVEKVRIVPETEIDFDWCKDRYGKRARDTYGMSDRLPDFVGSVVEIELFDYPRAYDSLIAESLEIKCK